MSFKFSKAYTWYLGFLLTISLLPILAPLLLKISESLPILILPARLIYLVYSFTCHQFAYRSIHAFDYQFAWCARDTGIWLGILLPALFASRLKNLSWYWVLPFVIPIALDGGIQTIATLLDVPVAGPTGAPLYVASNLARFMTGAIFGIGISLWISPFMWEAFGGTKLEDGNQKLENGFLRKWKFVLGGVGALLGVYILLVGFWALTSPTNRPSDLLDSAVKTPAVDFYIRRADGPCPANVDDLLRLKCLVSVQN